MVYVPSVSVSSACSPCGPCATTVTPATAAPVAASVTRPVSAPLLALCACAERVPSNNSRAVTILSVALTVLCMVSLLPQLGFDKAPIRYAALGVHDRAAKPQPRPTRTNTGGDDASLLATGSGSQMRRPMPRAVEPIAARRKAMSNDARLELCEIRVQ